MAKPRDLLRKQEITFDNHQPGKEAEWNDNLHFHKKMTVDNPKGKTTGVSGIFHVTKDRGVDVTYDNGKEHPKIKKEKERDFFSNKIKKEISGVIEKSNEEARSFLNRIMDGIDSISKGQNQQEIIRRKKQAFDSIMGALGITPKRKVVLQNDNNDILSLYIDNQKGEDSIDALLYLSRCYNRFYQYVNIPDVTVYYITYLKGKMIMGEMTPYAFLKFKTKKFKLSNKGIMESLQSHEE